MPLRLDIKKKLSSRSERVKSVDLHPTESWVLSALYSGTVMIWNYDTQTLVKSFEVTNLPVRNARFIARKQWIIASSDDLQIRVFNYNTMDRVAAFEGHTDYIRYMEIHPTLPYVLSCADDSQIKLWDWEKKWQCVQTFEGHGHYVMMVKFNPKDTNTFASAALDRTIKVWGLGSSQPHFSLEGHERGVNCIDYYAGGDKPYLVSGADDKTVKVWDYQTKSIIQTLDGHDHNLTSVLYHPRLPLIISACEDGTVRMWHSTTYRAETTLNYGMERAWSLSGLSSSNTLAIGYDEGTVVLRLGHDMPVVSMDPAGKIVWAKNNEIQTASIKGVVSELGIQDGERIPLSPRDLGSCEVYPQTLQHNSNGRFVVVCGDGEYIIYTSQQLRNKSFGSALDFCWSPLGTGDYVVRESISRIKLFKNFKETKAEKPRVCTAEGLYGGAAIGIRGSDCIAMYDWDELRLIRKIDVVPKNVYWSDSGDLVLLACEECYYVLKYDREVVSEAFANNANSMDEGIDGAFELIHEVSEKVGTGQWIGDCFLYTNSSARLNYYVGGEVITLSHFDQKMYMLGYLPKENRAYFMDKLRNVYSYTVNMVMLEYQTAVVRGDFDTANEILPRIPADQMDHIARFLESQGFKEEALQLSTDPDQKFDLAVQLAKLDVAKQIMIENIGDSDTTDAQHKWKQLGDLALNDCKLDLFEDCALRSDDFSGLLLLYSSLSNLDGMKKLAQLSKEKGRNNVAFLSLLLLGRLEDCSNLLLETKRYPEACFFARTYLPSKIPHVVECWREDLANVNRRTAKLLANPADHPEMFSDLPIALHAEESLRSQRGKLESAESYNLSSAYTRYEIDILEKVRETGQLGFTGATILSPVKSVQAEVERMHPRQFEEAEHQDALRAEAERLETEKADAEREAEQRIAVERAEAERQAALKVETERRMAEEKAEAERQETLKVEAERRMAAEKAEEERRMAEEKAEAERQEALKFEAERRMAAEIAEAARRMAEERAEAERQEALKVAAERRMAAEKAEEERQAALKIEAERLQAMERQETEQKVEAEAQTRPAPDTESSHRDSLDFDLDNDDLDFDDDDADWGDM